MAPRIRVNQRLSKGLSSRQSLFLKFSFSPDFLQNRFGDKTTQSNGTALAGIGHCCKKGLKPESAGGDASGPGVVESSPFGVE